MHCLFFLIQGEFIFLEFFGISLNSSSCQEEDRKNTMVVIFMFIKLTFLFGNGYTFNIDNLITNKI